MWWGSQWHVVKLHDKHWPITIWSCGETMKPPSGSILGRNDWHHESSSCGHSVCAHASWDPTCWFSQPIRCPQARSQLKRVVHSFSLDCYCLKLWPTPICWLSMLGIYVWIHISVQLSHMWSILCLKSRDNDCRSVGFWSGADADHIHVWPKRTCVDWLFHNSVEYYCGILLCDVSQLILLWNIIVE